MVKKALFLSFLFVSMTVVCQNRYMELKAIVTDSAGIFNENQLSELNEKLTAFELKTTNQLVVVTIESLGFETIEGYANGLFNENGLGQKGKDNGLLILFSKMDRQVRIEVGYGLEPYITDAVASRIIRNTMIPRFKDDQYFGGISDATDQLISFLNNPEALDEFKADIQTSEDRNQRIGIVFMILFLSVFVAIGGFFFFKSYSGLIEVLRGILIGKLGVLPGLFMVIGAMLSSLFGLIFIVVPVGVAITIYWSELLAIEELLEHPNLFLWILVPFLGISVLIAFIKIKFFGKDDFKFSFINNDRTYYRKTFSSSGTHSFGSSSSSGSSSSFSGGGGSSGGGGASGSW